MDGVIGSHFCFCCIHDKLTQFLKSTGEKSDLFRKDKVSISDWMAFWGFGHQESVGFLGGNRMTWKYSVARAGVFLMLWKGPSFIGWYFLKFIFVFVV